MSWHLRSFHTTLARLTTSCAVRRRCGIFHLTDQGLSTVRDCEMTGFHQHPSGIKIYQACAHVDLVETKPTVVDMRR